MSNRLYARRKLRAVHRKTLRHVAHKFPSVEIQLSGVKLDDDAITKVAEWIKSERARMPMTRESGAFSPFKFEVVEPPTLRARLVAWFKKITGEKE